MALSRPPKLDEELRRLQEAYWRLEEALPHLGSAEGPARRAVGLLEEAQQFLRTFVHPRRWPQRKRWKKVLPEEGLISVQDSLRYTITMLELRLRRQARLELQRVVLLLKEAVGLCAAAELDYLFSLGLPRNYRLLARIRPSSADFLSGLFLFGVYLLYTRAYPGGPRSRFWSEELLSFVLGLGWRFLAGRLGPGPGTWWPKRRYIWRSLAPYFAFLAALAGTWLAARHWEYWLGLAAIFATGFAFPFFRRALRALRAPEGTLIRCTRLCHSFFAPGGKIPSAGG